MSFQTKSYAKQALGNAGEISKAFNHYCNTEAVIIAGDSVKVGDFVQLKSGATDEREVIAIGSAVSGRILGVVVRDHLTSDCSCSTDGSLVCAKGSNANVLTSGNIFIPCSVVAKKGQKVCFTKATGAMVISDSVATTDVFSGFIVNIGNATATAGIIEITTSGANN